MSNYRYYAAVDILGNITGLYTDEPGYAPVPVGAIQLSDADGELLRSGFAGYQLVAGAAVRVIDYADLKAEAAAAIDKAAGSARAKYCAYDLQDKEYEMAYADAIAWLANQAAPVPETIQVWVRVNATRTWTALDAANDIKAAGDMMNSKLVQIRSVRIDGKGAVNACANDATAIAAARDAAVTALGLL